MRAIFDHAEPLVSNITSFWFKPEKPVKQTAGQFIEMRLPHENRDKRGDKRWFTLSSSPTEDLISITTKFAAENGSSFKQTLRALQPGAELQISEPMGDFVLPQDPSIPLVFVAGGIGLTPFRSIVKWLTDTGERREIHLLYGVNNEQEVVFGDLFKTYGLNLQIVVQNPSPGWTGLTGSLSGERILELAGPVEGKLFYISGPEPMVEAFDKDLRHLGVNKKQLILDFFPSYTEI